MYSPCVRLFILQNRKTCLSFQNHPNNFPRCWIESLAHALITRLGSLFFRQVLLPFFQHFFPHLTILLRQVREEDPFCCTVHYAFHFGLRFMAAGLSQPGMWRFPCFTKPRTIREIWKSASNPRSKWIMVQFQKKKVDVQEKEMTNAMWRCLETISCIDTGRVLHQ